VKRLTRYVLTAAAVIRVCGGIAFAASRGGHRYV
jgi:hypothetical protein